MFTTFVSILASVVRSTLSAHLIHSCTSQTTAPISQIRTNKNEQKTERNYFSSCMTPLDTCLNSGPLHSATLAKERFGKNKRKRKKKKQGSTIPVTSLTALPLMEIYIYIYIFFLSEGSLPWLVNHKGRKNKI